MSLDKRKGMKAQRDLARRARNNARICRSRAAAARDEAERQRLLAEAEAHDREEAYRESEYERISKEDG